MSLRKIVAFILITCATATSFAQEIKGMSDFTIGMSVEEFLDLPLIKEKNIQDKASRNYPYRTDERVVWKTTADSQLGKYHRKYDRIYSADIVKFEFKAPMGVPGHSGEDSYDVTTKFYKGKLAQVDIPNPGRDFDKILTTKYGKPIKEDKLKSVVCQNDYGVESSSIVGSTSTIWGKGKKITATLGNFYFGCGRASFSYTVEESATVKVMDRINENGSKASEAEKGKVKADASKL